VNALKEPLSFLVNITLVGAGLFCFYLSYYLFWLTLLFFAGEGYEHDTLAKIVPMPLMLVVTPLLGVACLTSFAAAFWLPYKAFLRIISPKEPTQ
jgi:hypothetical protein